MYTLLLPRFSLPEPQLAISLLHLPVSQPYNSKSDDYRDTKQSSSTDLAKNEPQVGTEKRGNRMNMSRQIKKAIEVHSQ